MISSLFNFKMGGRRGECLGMYCRVSTFVFWNIPKQNTQTAVCMFCFYTSIFDLRCLKTWNLCVFVEDITSTIVLPKARDLFAMYGVVVWFGCVVDTHCISHYLSNASREIVIPFYPQAVTCFLQACGTCSMSPELGLCICSTMYSICSTKPLPNHSLLTTSL